MKTYNKLYTSFCSLSNLNLAFKKARKGKTLKRYVIDFEKNLKENLWRLHQELEEETYSPLPLKTFILRDPKTRKISVSSFRDRIIHHALINILEPIFEPIFIYDSYASRKGKGALAALKRFDQFKRKVSHNNTRPCFILKMDIRHYFEEVSHQILIETISKKTKDQKLMHLINLILKNFPVNGIGKGMPLGNHTSQFFANIYLTELDYFIKHELKEKYYLRYVDDFVILHHSKEHLDNHKLKIHQFLKEKLNLELHPEKSKIFKLKQGLGFLGFKIFYYHKLLKKKNLKIFKKKLVFFCSSYGKKLVSYDEIYNFLEGWIAYAKNADTYKLRELITSRFEKTFPNEISFKEINRSAH